MPESPKNSKAGYRCNFIKGFWSVKVDKNYRIILRFEGENVYDVDYIDYH